MKTARVQVLTRSRSGTGFAKKLKKLRNASVSVAISKILLI